MSHGLPMYALSRFQHKDRLKNLLDNLEEFKREVMQGEFISDWDSADSFCDGLQCADECPLNDPMCLPYKVYKFYCGDIDYECSEAALEAMEAIAKVKTALKT